MRARVIAPRWRKVLRDIELRFGRSALAVLAMAAGIFGLGTILTAYSVLRRELPATYVETRPASAVLVASAVADEQVALARRIPGVRDAEARPVIRGRIRVGEDRWVPLVLFVVRDFADVRIDTFRREDGARPPADDEVLLERTSLGVADAAIGDRVTVSTGEGGERALRVAGSVHAAGLAPAWMDHIVTGFVGWGSVVRASAQAASPQLRIVVAEDPLDEAHIREVAGRVRDALAASGVEVERVEVPAPGRHPHADQMDTFLFLLGAFGVLALVLSAVLVANLVHALLIEEVRQVGVMKAIGATSRQISGLYLGQVSILAAAALCVGVPMGAWAGRGYAAFSSTILNADLASTAIPAWAVALQIAVGIGVPLLVALGPVRRAARIPIHQAFSDDIGRKPFGTRPFDRRLARLAWLPRPLMLSLRATFHRRARLALTIGTLAAGGAVFVSALNVSAAWERAVASEFDARRYDLDVRLSRPVSADALAAVLDSAPGVAHAEYWADARAELAGAGDDHDDTVSLLGPPPGSTLLALPLLAGRWLAPDDRAAAVVNQALASRDPRFVVGGDVALRVDGRDVVWPIVGVVAELGSRPTVYAPARAVLDASGQSGGSTLGARVVARQRGAEAQVALAAELERALARAGLEVLHIQPLSDRRKAIEDHLVIIVSALLLATGLVVLVGSLGLMSTLTLNVVERTREIGILGAIGARPRTIASHVVFEGVAIGVLSWCAALLVAAPVTAVLDSVAGRIFIRAPLDFFMSPRAAAIWLGFVVVLAALSSFHPARRAARLTVREALAHV